MANVDDTAFRREELLFFASKEHLYKDLLNKLCFVKDVNTQTSSENAWATAKLVSYDNNGKFTARMVYDSSIKVDIEYDKLLITNESVCDDLCDLKYGHEPALIANIGQRYLQQKYFTAMGPGLVFVNPGKSSVYLDSYKSNETYYNNYGTKQWNMLNAPHIFALAQDAYDIMCFGKRAQSVIVSGENGSGKSECVESFVDYLLYRSYTPLVDEDEPRSFDNRLRGAAVILNAFGNAKINCNNNSTRFGKYIKLLFIENNLKSATIETFLLESQRVVRTGFQERSFNAFYQLLAPSDADEHSFRRYLKHLRLGKVSDYCYLSQEGMVSTINDADKMAIKHDQDQFDMLVEAMAIVGFSADQILGVLQLLASILFLGNIEFEDVEEEDEDAPVANVKNPAVLQKLANALAVDVYDMNNLLTETKATVKGKVIIKRINSLVATHIRDWIAKSLYQALFLMLTDYINASLENREEFDENVDEKLVSSIGIADLCGIGDHELNEFEHFLINYANEVMHHNYLYQVFFQELSKLDEEGIVHDPWKFNFKDFDNSGCVALIADVDKSIFSLLNGVCLSSKEHEHDDIFLERLQDEKYFNSKHPFFPEQSAEDRKHSFVIEHYTGPTKYTLFPKAIEDHMGVKGNAWTYKNHDETPFGLWELIASSKIDDIAKAASHLPSKEHIDLTSIQTAQQQVDSFRDQIKHTLNMHVHCIASNVNGSVDVFDNVHATKQLHTLHIVESTAVFKALYPIQVPFKHIISTLGGIADAINEIFQGQHEVMLISCILMAHKLPYTEYKVGKNTIFLRPTVLSRAAVIMKGPQTEKEQDELLALLAEVVQKVHASFALVKHMEDEVKDFTAALLICKNQVGNFKTNYDKFCKGRKPTARLQELYVSVLDQEKVFETIGTILKDLSIGVAEAKEMCSYGHADDVKAIFTELDVRMEVLVSHIQKVTTYVASCQADLDKAIVDISELEANFEAQVRLTEERYAYKLEQHATLSDAMVASERAQRQAAEKRAQAELKARQDLEQERAAIAAQKEHLEKQRTEQEKVFKEKYTAAEARKATMQSEELQKVLQEIEISKKESEYLSDQANAERLRAEAARKKAADVHEAFLAKEKVRVEEAQAFLQKREKELLEQAERREREILEQVQQREKELREEAERRINEVAQKLAEEKLRETAKLLAEAHERELHAKEAKIKELERAHAQQKEKEASRLNKELELRQATEGQAVQRENFLKYVKEQMIQGEESSYFAMNLIINAAEKCANEELKNGDIAAKAALRARLNAELPFIELEQIKVQARLERARMAEGLLKGTALEIHNAKVLEGNFTTKLLGDWKNEKDALTTTAQKAQDLARLAEEEEKEEARDMTTKMSAWISANCRHITAKDADKYAQAFYDNKLKVIARVARRLQDDPDFMTTLGFDKYDIEELAVALGNYTPESSRPGVQVAAPMLIMSTPPPPPPLAAFVAQKTPFSNSYDKSPAFDIQGDNLRADTTQEDDEPEGEPGEEDVVSVISGASKVKSSLPTGWTVKKDRKTGKLYYKNSVTGEKTFRKPEEEESRSPSKSKKDKEEVGESSDKRSSRRASTSSREQTPVTSSRDDLLGGESSEKRSSRRASTSASKKDKEEVGESSDKRSSRRASTSSREQTPVTSSRDDLLGGESSEKRSSRRASTSASKKDKEEDGEQTETEEKEKRSKKDKSTDEMPDTDKEKRKSRRESTKS